MSGGEGIISEIKGSIVWQPPQVGKASLNALIKVLIAELVCESGISSRVQLF